MRARYTDEILLLRDLDIAVGDLSAKVVSRQLERDFAVRDADVRMVIDRFEIRDETVDELSD